MTTTRSTTGAFPTPRPNRVLMSGLGLVNRWLMLRWRFRIREIDLPRADRDRLARAVNPRTASFIAPNHPEFGFDWMLDKELSRLFAPRMAAWAAHEIIAAAPWFWTRNNLVSHRGGAAAIDYSVEWALRGHGVLLHPEGSVHWTSGHVHPLFPGIAEMALAAFARANARRDGRPVFIVPVVWRLQYTRDVSAGLHGDMETLERSLGLPAGRGSTVSERFEALQENVLAGRMARFGFDLGSVAELDFFAKQAAFRAWLIDDLLLRHRVECADSIEYTMHRLARLPLDAHDRARLHEAGRLGGFTAHVYGSPTLTQEEIGESLKRLRASLLKRGMRNAIHNALPKPYGPRVVHVRVPEPILVDAQNASGGGEHGRLYRTALLERTRSVMQAQLDALGGELAPATDAFRHWNPFYRATELRPSSPVPPASAPSAGASRP